MEVLHEFRASLPPRETEGGEQQQQQQQVSWQVCENPDSGSLDELCVSGNHVIWTEGLDPSCRRVVKSYSMDGPVLQALCCSFRAGDKGLPPSSPSSSRGGRCICVREQDCLTLFMDGGDMHLVPLPFLVRCVYPVLGGLLLEREVQSECGGGGDGLPVLFTLLHPLDDLCPVTFRRPAANDEEVNIVGFFSDPLVRVVRVVRGEGEGGGPSLVVCYDATTRRHSVWALKEARLEDIPVHATTPHRLTSGGGGGGGGAGLTPTHPMSSSDPTSYHCYSSGRPDSATLLDTPVEMILSVKKQTPAEVLKLPVLAQLQRTTPWGGGASSQRGVVRMGSGRSPFVSRLQTPQSEASSFLQKRARSLSPPLLARVSPFSQTVNSRSWSTFYSEESLTDSYQPLVPQACLSRVWLQDDQSSVCTQVDQVFHCTDLTGVSYLAFLLPSSLEQLRLLRCPPPQPAVTGGSGLEFGPLSPPLPCRQAVFLRSLSLTVVLAPSGELALYSGTHKMVVLDRQPLLEMSSVAMDVGVASVAGLRDPSGDGFTAVLASGKMFRCKLPLLDRDHTVSLCLRALQHLLPSDAHHRFLLSCHASSLRLCHAHLLPRFLSLVRAALGLTSDPTSASSAPLQDPTLATTLPALRLFQRKRGVVTTPPVCCTEEDIVGLHPHVHSVLLALHLVYEELKLNTLIKQRDLHLLAALLHQISCFLALPEYGDHYRRDFPSLFLASHDMQALGEGDEKMELSSHPHTLPPSPPHILRWLCEALRGAPPSSPFPTLPAVCERTTLLIKLYGLYTCEEGGVVSLDALVTAVGGDTTSEQQQQQQHDHFSCLQSKSSSPFERVVLALVAEGVKLSDLESLPVGVALPVWGCIVHCQQFPPPAWPPSAYDIIGRSDVAKTLGKNHTTAQIEDPKDCDDGMDTEQEILKLRFPQDLRLAEVRRLLQSSRPVRIALTQKPEVSDHEFIEEQEGHLLAVCQRTMALPVGRGMFTISTVQPMPTAPLAIPKLNLAGRAPPRNSAVGLDHVEKPANMAQWAEFHNGVAAGLRIAPSASKLDSAWIVFNRPSEDASSNQYAGFLMALGLNQHLSSLPEFQLYECLHHKHELTVVALLLGTSAARVGSMSASLASLLSIYLPPFLPPGAADMEISLPMQTAAMVGMGLLFLGSGNRHVVEVMLKEVGHPPGPELEFAENRESYSLAAGLALGMLTLGLGGSLKGLADLNLVDQLCILMNGGLKSEVSIPHVPTPSHLILEGDLVNTHVTCPGAVVALGLMFLKTNDSSVAGLLEVPSTMYDLDCLRPDFLLLRAFSRGLVMWDEIEPTQDWINSRIPQIVKRVALSELPNLDPSLDVQTLCQALFNITAGCCLAMGFRFAGSCDTRAYDCLLQNVRHLLGKLSSTAAVEQAGRPCLESCLSVTVIALAMVVSGSGDLEVLRIIRRLHVRVWHSDVTYGNHMATHMAMGILFLGGGRYSLARSNTAIAALLCALFPKFPSSSCDNRYHLQALRHLYLLAVEPRVLVTREVRSGRVCSVDVCITARGEEKQVVTPCLIPEWSAIERVTVCGDHHWPLTLDLSQEATKSVLCKSGTVFVKKRVAFSSPLAGLFSRHHGTALGGVAGKVRLPGYEAVCDPLVSAYCQFIEQSGMQKASKWGKFFSAALLECISQEKLQVFTSYLHLEQVVSSLPVSRGVLQLWQVKLAGAALSGPSGEGRGLLARGYTDGLLLRLKSFLDQATAQWGGWAPLLRWYIQGGGEGEAAPHCWTEDEAWTLALALLLYSAPTVTHKHRLASLLKIAEIH